MQTSSSVMLCYGAISEPDEGSIRPTRDPPPGSAGDWPQAALLLVKDRDRIAADMNDVVVHRLFAAGLALETALGLMGSHPGAGRSGKPSVSWTWPSGMSGTSCSITISLIRSPEGSRARASRPLPGELRPPFCRLPARRRLPGAGEKRPPRGTAETVRSPGAGSRPHRRGHERPRGAPAVRRGARSRNGTGADGRPSGNLEGPEAIGELDLAIRDVRNVVFDHYQPDPLSGGQPGSEHFGRCPASCVPGFVGSQHGAGLSGRARTSATRDSGDRQVRCRRRPRGARR